MFYEATIKAVEMLVQELEPGVLAQELDIPKSGPVPLPYLLWMAEEVKNMDTSSLELAVKAGRWIGWILREIEVQGFWDNNHSRDLTREDKVNGLDRPH